MSDGESITFGSLRVTGLAGDRWHQKAYVVVDRATNEAIVIDPGTGSMPRLIQTLKRTHLDSILLTHGHYDHFGAAAELSIQTGTVCRVHERDLALVRDAPLYALAFEGRTFGMPTKVETFGDQDSFQVGHHLVRVLPCPGHTPGSVAFLAGPLLFSGDTILRLKIGRTDLPGGEPTTLAGSVSRLLDHNDHAEQILPGHGRPWTMAEARAWWRSQIAVRR